METRANYVLIGAFTLVVSVFGLLFALWAANWSSEREWIRYRIIFNEAVTGLSVGGSVRYNGITVGTVQELKLAPDDPRQVLAIVRIDAQTPIKTDTRAKISQDGLTGPTFIQLSGGTPGAPRLLPRERDDLPLIRTEPSALQNIADTANRLVARLDEVLSEQNVRRIANTLESLEAMTGAVAGQREDLRALIVAARKSSEQLETTLRTTNAALQDIDRELVDKLPALTSRLDRTLRELESAAANANGILAENRGAIGSFAGDGLAQLGPTLVELRALVLSLRRISDRLDQNPAGYLLGRDATKEFEPE
ncbi:MlaD family protein [Vulcaniibacterium gelatinicum]|uniref:MlaD family protein n=1 Tax=Vulcaniibacterium gelatinicum TaxID=2598725 RepID=UPI0011CA1FFF|nr:MlaD family protein [Vulcaniibacterium gelatinicum]